MSAKGQMGEWPAIDPGAMRHRIRVLAPEMGSDASGASVTYVELFSTLAAIEQEQRGRDHNENRGQQTSEEMLTFRLWYDARLKSDMRIETDGGTYVVQQVIDVQQMNIVMRLICVGLGVNA